MQKRHVGHPALLPFWIFGEFEGAEGGLGVAVSAVGEECEGGGHAKIAGELADLQIAGEKVPLAEEESPVADFGVDERESVGAGILHVSADVEKIFKEPESGEDETIGLTVEEKIERAEERNEKFAQRAAEEHDGVASPGEEEVAGFVDHQIDEVGKEEAGGVAEGVEEEERIGEEPGEAGVAGDGVPGFGFGKGERHGIRVAVERMT